MNILSRVPRSSRWQHTRTKQLQPIPQFLRVNMWSYRCSCYSVVDCREWEAIVGDGAKGYATVRREGREERRQFIDRGPTNPLTRPTLVGCRADGKDKNIVGRWRYTVSHSSRGCCWRRSVITAPSYSVWHLFGRRNWYSQSAIGIYERRSGLGMFATIRTTGLERVGDEHLACVERGRARILSSTHESEYHHYRYGDKPY